MFVFNLFQVRFSWISRGSWLPTRSVPFSVNSLLACTSGAFIPGVTEVQCHSPRAVIPLYHPTPSNSRNARCTGACTGVKNKWGTKVFWFPSLFEWLLQFLYLCSSLISILPSLLPLLYNVPKNISVPKKFYTPASTVSSPQKLQENKDPGNVSAHYNSKGELQKHAACIKITGRRGDSRETVFHANQCELTSSKALSKWTILQWHGN